MADFSRLQVAAGILIAADGKILLSERVGDTPLAGLWEFPGGKRHSGESAEQALRRELNEELGIVAEAVTAFLSLQHDYPDRSVAIDFFLVTDWRGAPSSCEGQALRWTALAGINPATLLPADAPVLDALHRVLPVSTQPA